MVQHQEADCGDHWRRIDDIVRSGNTNTSVSVDRSRHPSAPLRDDDHGGGFGALWLLHLGLDKNNLKLKESIPVSGFNNGRDRGTFGIDIE
jgi:hypothetical protein